MFERVYTVTDWYDGPRIGVADFEGRPHRFESTFADIDRDAEDQFLLWPITADQLALALEDWAIWRRWQVAFHAGQTTLETHPALPEDRRRHLDLRTRINAEGLGETRPAWRSAETAIAAFAEWETGEIDNGHASSRVRWRLT